MKRYFLWITSVSAMLVLIIMLAGCPGGQPQQSTTSPTVKKKPTKVAQVAQKGSRVTVKGAADWAAKYPDIYASYIRNDDNSKQDDYTKKYPMIVTLYEGMGFSKFYKSARGHVYSVEDLNNTGRPHPLANCYACKTPNFHALANEIGPEAYKIPYNDLVGKMTEPVSCFNCHANEPGILTVTHTYLADALGQNLYSVDPAILACAQCHVEYYFDPVTRVVTLPYNSLDTMAPDSILKFYNDLKVNGEPFADYVNPRSGVRQIKVQHPEFETFLGKGSVHANGYRCADCHMSTAVNSNGQSYTNHRWMSPLDNATLLQDDCSACHKDLAADVRKIQDLVQNRTKKIGNALAELMEELVLAVKSEKYEKEKLDAIRKVFRDAQFYWDFVFVENSNGAHNSKLTHQCLDKSEALLNEAKSLLKKL